MSLTPENARRFGKVWHLPTPVILIGLLLVGLLVATILSGCGKATEPFNDADIAGTNDEPADIVNFPDGFSNVSTKCDHGNRIYVVYHADSPYGSVAVVPGDPTCAGLP